MAPTSVLENERGNEATFTPRGFKKPHNVTSAQGCYLTLLDGRKILDACGGAAVAVIGHGNEEVLDATVDQMRRVSYVHTAAYTTDSAEELARCILSYPPNPRHGLEKAFFINSGSEANEGAMKMVRQYFWEKGETQRVHFVSRQRGYHGNTLAAMSISTNPARKIPYEDSITLPNVSHVSPAYSYRDRAPSETEECYVARLIAELDGEFKRIGTTRVAAFFAETVVGAMCGSLAAPRGYFQQVRSLCDKYGILLVLDEVMCGMGRTGTYFAFEQEDIQPDMVTIGKGLGGGYAPIAGILMSKKVVDVLRAGTGSFNHGHTYQAHPVSCATALAVQRIIQRDGLVQRSAEMGRKLQQLLRQSFSGCAYLLFASKVQMVAFEMGVAVYPSPVTSAGSDRDHILLAPPFTVTKDELEIAVQALRAAYDVVEQELIASVDLNC
ncbi:unnamed protein product [Parascedosporium putredinis]|uniref:Aminotransferase n=1 Tax=Parascedosporium putredinis TaxID=1442378 RepID=A0A9P1H0D2_9PEZI|nr:unnamed protein product [Parascedosporium putredinis]CAI7993793.1 unnamed protein product [Parascedosporium putredinis]